MRATFLALVSVAVLALQLSLPVALALGIDPCANAGDHDCPPLGDDCHDCARCSPMPAIVPAAPMVILEGFDVPQELPEWTVQSRPPEAPREPPMRVPRAFA